MLGGGEFANGAQTGTFGYLFNALAHRNAPLPLYSQPQLTNIIFEETESLTGDGAYDVRVAVGAIAINPLDAGMAGGVGTNAANPGELLASEASRIASGNPAEIAAYKNSSAAAYEALAPGFVDPTGGALYFRMILPNVNPGKSYTRWGMIGPIRNNSPSPYIPANAYLRFYSDTGRRMGIFRKFVIPTVIFIISKFSYGIELDQRLSNISGPFFVVGCTTPSKSLIIQFFLVGAKEGYLLELQDNAKQGGRTNVLNEATLTHSANRWNVDVAFGGLASVPYIEMVSRNLLKKGYVLRREILSRNEAPAWPACNIK